MTNVRIYLSVDVGLSDLAKLRKVTISFVESVRLFFRQFTWNNWALTTRIFPEVLNFRIFRKSVERIGFSLKPDKIKRHFT